MAIWVWLAASTAPDVARFRADIEQASSATAVLQAHCATHAMTALRVDETAKRPPRTIRKRLRIHRAEPVRYRHVRLMCGAILFSDADNWYVPGRLTPAMNAALDTSDVPFGKVIAPLKARRTIIRAKEGDRTAFLTVTAVLTSQSGVPLSGVIERYQAAVLDAVGKAD